MPAPTTLTEPQWRAARQAHQARVDALLAGHLARAARGEKHPVEDFLFTYYSHRPAHLRRWHPGVGTTLEPARHPAPDDPQPLDVAAFLARREQAVRFAHGLLAATAARPAHLGCFGLHEWAMVYRLDADAVRHARWPLRLGSAGTDAVVESHRIRCSHFDAYRFFTADAVQRNELRPTRETQTAFEQPGCLHATMDLYKWAYKLSPATPSELVVDCLELARDVRTLDMRAAPYDLSALGYEPVRIETADGKAEYVAAQKGFADRGAVLRARLVAVCEQLLGAGQRRDTC